MKERKKILIIALTLRNAKENGLNTNKKKIMVFAKLALKLKI